MSIVQRINILCVFMCVSIPAFAVDPRLNWNTIESQNFYIHYADGYAHLAQKTANAAEQAHQNLQPKLNWQPKEKTHLVVSDETDSANGFATPINFNKSVLFVAPPDSANSLEDFDDWLETLITHEYTHILHLDKIGGNAQALRGVFGRQFLFFPNAYQPGWMIEGLSTFYETDNEKAIGRGQSSIFKMMMRTEIDNGIKPVSQVNLPIRSWPLGTVSYLYGVHFYQFLDEVYGEEGAANLIENYSDNVIPFMINSNAQEVLNKDIDTLWDGFSAWLTERYQPEMSAHKSMGLVEGEKITDLGYNTGPVEIKNKDEMLYVAGGPFKHTQLMRRVNGANVFVTELSRGATINYHADAGVLVVQKDYCDEYNINGDIYIVKNTQVKAITKCGRYRTAAWSADGQSIYAVQVKKGKSQLLQLNLQGDIIKSLWQGNDTDIVSQIKISPSAEYLLAAVFRTQQGWNIEEFNLITHKWLAITNDRFIDMYPSYSDNGNSILLSSERSGRYQVYRYKKSDASLQQLTNVATGAFNPIQYSQQTPLFYVGYHANGRDIYQLDNKDMKDITVKPEVNENAAPRLVVLAPQVSTSKAEKYSPSSSLDPRWWLPILAFAEDRNEIGFITSASDALGIHNYRLTLAYDTTNEWLLGNVNYSYADRFSMGYRRSIDIIKFDTGEFALSREIQEMFISLGYSDLGIENSVRYQLGAVFSQASDGDRAVGVPEQASAQDSLLGAGLIFDNTQRYVRSISRNEGRNLRVTAETYEAIESRFKGEVYSLDWREFINLGQQHVLAARFVQGWGTDNPKRFSLGGEQSAFNILSLIEGSADTVFNKRVYALRGYAEGLPQLTGRRMQLATVEWRFPGSLIERGFMAPPVAVIQWSGALFAETGAAYNANTAEDYYSSVGLELQADVTLFYGLTSRMRLGLANGLDSEIGEQRLYFNMGAAF